MDSLYTRALLSEPPFQTPPPPSSWELKRAPCVTFVGLLFLHGPWTVTDSSLRVLRRAAAFCRPLRPVFLLVSLLRWRIPGIGVLGVVLVGAGVVSWLLLPSALRTPVTHHLPRCVSAGMWWLGVRLMWGPCLGSWLRPGHGLLHLPWGGGKKVCRGGGPFEPPEGGRGGDCRREDRVTVEGPVKKQQPAQPRPQPEPQPQLQHPYECQPQPQP